MVKPRRVRVVWVVIVGWAEDEAKVAVEILDVRIATEGELVLAKAERIFQDEIVESL